MIIIVGLLTYLGWVIEANPLYFVAIGLVCAAEIGKVIAANKKKENKKE